MRLSAAIVALALLSLAAFSAAQTPTASAGVTVAIEGDTATTSVDRPGEFKVTVTNTGTASGTPLDDQNQASVDVSVAGMPAGWTAAVAPASFQLRPGASQSVTVTVSVSADAAAKAADLTVKADLVAPLGPLDPILGAGGQSQRASGSDTIHVVRDDSVTRDLLENIGPWIYAILLLLVAAVLVAIGISLASRRSLVRLSSEARELQVPPGGRIAFPFKVEGLAKVEDAVLLQVSAVQEGWAAFLPVPELVLDPGQVQELNLVVISPKEASDGSRQAILVSATSAKAPKGAANLEFVATVQSGTPLRAQRRAKGD